MRRLSIGLLALAVTLTATSCTDERVVYRDRDLLGDLAAGAGGFVGYTNAESKLTVCGNCHVSQQNQWVATAHAGAFLTIAQHANRQVCEGCHTVNGRGNEGPNTAGFVATEEPRYHDVQCESCHGPGEPHVRNPDGGTIPLASIEAGVNMDGTCAECHTGFHHPFVEEWAASGHGTALASPAGRAECAGCHEGKAALLAFGVLTTYEEEGSSDAIAITCAVCHDPHRARFEGQLRYSVGVADEEQNLCMRCHHKRGGPDPASPNRGPHSPEGPMLLGEAGWWPPNMPVEPGERIVGTHGSEANPRMCAGCHVQDYTVVDPQAGNATMVTTGHLFEAIPCLDANGQPVPDDTCAFSERSFRSCTTAGCHGSQNAARSIMLTVRQRIDALNAQLKSQLARIPASEFSTTDNRYTTAEGSRFNSQLADRSGSVVHNPFLLEALLIGSIQQIQREYGIAPSLAISLERQLKQPAEHMN